MRKASLVALVAMGVSMLAGCTAATEGDEGAEGDGTASAIAGAEGPVGTATQAVNTGRMVICAGGNAPVRYYNASTCNGTVQDYYPQGWHGWAQTVGQCNTSGWDWYFHPDNGAHGGYIEEWRLCNY